MIRPYCRSASDGPSLPIVPTDNFVVRIEGAGVDPERVAGALGMLADAAWWDEPRTRNDLLAKQPEYRLSKFQRAMPDWAATEMVAAYLLDVQGTVAFVEK